MKKLYTFLVACLVAGYAVAQCTPNGAANVTVVHPLPTDPLPNANIDVPYQGTGETISFAASGNAIDAAILASLVGSLPVPVPPGLATFSVQRIEVVSVDGLPPGMTATPSDVPSEWSAPDAGCFLLAGTPTASGNYTITFNTIMDVDYTSPLGNGSMTTPESPISYDLQVIGHASVDEFASEGLNLFPNPASDIFSISYPATGANTASLEIFDMSGKKVYAGQKSISSAGGTISLDVNGLANGLYRVSFVSGNVRTASKLTVSK